MKTSIKKATKTVTKKAAPKKAVKSTSSTVSKVAKNKAVTKKVPKVASKKELVVASNYNSFWMNDGQILNTLRALEKVLLTMDRAVYKYHTQANRHDFANWVEDVLHDIECAHALRKAKTPQSAHRVVVKYLTLYT